MSEVLEAFVKIFTTLFDIIKTLWGLIENIFKNIKHLFELLILMLKGLGYLVTVFLSGFTIIFTLISD